MTSHSHFVAREFRHQRSAVEPTCIITFDPASVHVAFIVLEIHKKNPTNNRIHKSQHMSLSLQIRAGDQSIVRVYCKGFEWISLGSRRDRETISPRQVQILQCSSSSDTQTLMTDGSSSWNLSAIFVKCFFFYS